MQQLTRVSSSWTLYYKVFIPTVWIVFFGALIAIALVLTQMDRLRLSAPLIIGAIMFYVAGLIMLRLSLLRLQRVELDKDCFYVTNYFKTYKYRYESIVAISERDLMIMKLATFTLAGKSSFGKHIHFIQRRKVWRDFVDQNPSRFSHILETPET